MVPRRRVAGPPPPHGMPPPPPALNKQAHVIHVTVDVPHGMPPPSHQASCLSKRGGAGAITHNTWNTRREPQGRGGKDKTQGTTGPLALPLPFDTQMRMMAMMLCAMTLMCYSQCGCWRYLCSYVARGFGTACSLLYLIENRAWLVMFLRKLYRSLSFKAKFGLGSLKA